MERVKVQIILFVDDLDRCLDGRNVKVLEAIQLLLNTPGSPVLIFLAIDTKVIAASIENQFNRSLDIHDAEISGQEYLSKIIQLPFCIPEVSFTKIQSYITNCSRSSPVKYGHVVKQFTDLIEFARKVDEELVDKVRYTLYFNFSDQKGINNDSKTFESFYSHVKKFMVKKMRSFKDDNEFLKIVGEQMNNSTRSAVKKFSIVGETEGTEDFLHSMLDALSETSLFFHDKKSTHQIESVDVSQVNKLDGSSFEKYVIKGDEWANKFLDTIPGKALKDKCKKELSKLKDKKSRYENQSLISTDMRNLVTSLSVMINCNPRSLKRILNVLQVISEVVKVMQRSPHDLVVDEKQWPVFSRKIAVWIFLCEVFPFRISFLVHRLRDYIHKVGYNKKTRVMFYGMGAAKWTDLVNGKIVFYLHTICMCNWMYTVY